MSVVISLFAPQISRTSGGIQNTSYYMALELSQYYTVDVYSLLDNNEIIENSNICFHNHANGNRLINTLRNYFEVNQKFRKNRNETNVSICMTWKNAVVPFLLRKRNKYIVLTHGDEVLPQKAGTVGKFNESLRKKVLENSILICANSKFTSELVHKICPNKECRIIHPISGEKIVKRKEGDLYTIFSIGRLEERKGFQYVLRAVSQLKQEYPQMLYYIAGNGPYCEELKKLSKTLDVEKNVVFLGRINEETKSNMIDRAQVVVMPSFYIKENNSVEGFGIIFIEANAHGKPVIGTNSGGIPDAIKNNETGIIVEEKNVDQLINAIKSIFDNTILFNEANCQNWAKKHYYKEIVAEYRNEIEKIGELF